ncbi:MAG: hypothetical protein M1833_002225 [Piccolia ochrophora]|nr:MAG: hypothetical protein M1833_002225 [Piccolia ochrophora]
MSHSVENLDVDRDDDEDFTSVVRSLVDGFGAISKELARLNDQTSLLNERLSRSDERIRELESNKNPARKALKDSISPSKSAAPPVCQARSRTSEDPGKTLLRSNRSIEENFTTSGREGGLQCPFAAMGATKPVDHPALPNLQMSPGHAPTDPIEAELHASQSSPPPSATVSTSKCPIRFLDQHSPEEVAQYFERHKHEIPRSHEICVKRYQTNSESIRELDAKYGNLVSMIQGLGLKHQSLLPTKEEDEAASSGHITNDRVSKWAKGVSESVSGSKAVFLEGNGEGGDMERSGHFDRPLKDVRVGESPSRPWGISVPIAKTTKLSIPTEQGEPQYKLPHRSGTPITQGLGNDSPIQSPPLSGPSGSRQGNGVLGESGKKRSTDSARVHPGAAIVQPMSEPTSPSRTMLFTGPVFIGYPVDQALTILRETRSGLGLAHQDNR